MANNKSKNVSAADRESAQEKCPGMWGEEKTKNSGKSSGEFSYILGQSKHFNLSIMLFLIFRLATTFPWHFPVHIHNLIENGQCSLVGSRDRDRDPQGLITHFSFTFSTEVERPYIHTLIKCPQQKLLASKWNAGRGLGFKWLNLHGELVKKFNLPFPGCLVLGACCCFHFNFLFLASSCPSSPLVSN